MPSKKIYRPQFVFMNNRVIHPEQKNVRPVMKPVIIAERHANRNPLGVRFK